MDSIVYALLAAFVVSLISFVGAFTLSLQLQKRRGLLMMLVSLGAGTMLAAGILDLLPEAIEKAGAAAFPFVLIGMVIFFVVEKMLFWHHYHELHNHSASHGGHHHARKFIQPVGYLNLVGDGIHNFFDGVAIAAGFLVGMPLGIITTVAVIMHEIPQELADFGVLLHAGFTPRQGLLFNFLSALTAMAGVAVTFALESSVGGLEAVFLPIAAGGFLYIAAADLIPELKHEENPRQSLVQLVPFTLGILMIWWMMQAFAA